MIFFLSATGNSRAVARLLSDFLQDGQVVDLRVFLQDQSLPFRFEIEADERVGFVFPIHSWGLPKLFGNLLASLQLKGYVPHRNYCYMVCTCGDDAGLAARQWQDCLRKAGIEGNAAFSVFMPNTYVLLPGFDVDSDSICRQKLADAPAVVERIAGQIKKNEEGDFTHHGACSWLKSRVIYPSFMRCVRDKAFHVDAASCIGCGKCVQACPTGNILLRADAEGAMRPVWNGNCLNCLACYHLCPMHSIRYGSRTSHKGTYSFKGFVKKTP